MDEVSKLSYVLLQKLEATYWSLLQLEIVDHSSIVRFVDDMFLSLQKPTETDWNLLEICRLWVAVVSYIQPSLALSVNKSHIVLPHLPVS